MEQALSILVGYVLPILAGVIIGYGTNWLAIRLVFWPHRRLYLFKLPVPLTPGLIPRKRHQIARNIAHSVGNLLLDEELVRRKVQSDQVRTRLKEYAADLWNRVYLQELPPILDWVPQAHRHDVERGFYAVLELAVQKLSEWISDKEHSASFIRAGASILDADHGQAKRSLAELLTQVFASPELRAQVKTLVTKWVPERESQVTLADLLGEEAVVRVRQRSRESIPDLLKMASGALSEPQTLHMIGNEARLWLEDYMASQNAMTRFVSRVMGFEEQVERKLPATIGRLINEYSTGQREIPSALVGAIDRLVDQLLAAHPRALLTAIVPDGAPEAGSRGELMDEDDRLADFFIRILTRQETAEQVADSVLQSLTSSDSPESQPVRDYLQTILADTIGEEAFQQRVIDKLYDVFWPLIRERRVGPLYHVAPLTEQTQDRILSAMTDQAIDLAVDHVLPALQMLNVQGIIEQKVNALPPDRLEALVLSAVKRHLGAIHVLGGIIGGLIGLINVLLNSQVVL